MVKIMKTALLGLLLAASLATCAVAAPKTFKCPACGMPMALKKTSVMTVPVYVKSAKTVYYCCPACKAGKAAAAYMKMHHKPMPV